MLFRSLLVSEVVVETLERLDPQYPEVGDAQKRALETCREQLLEEKEP